MTNSSTMESHRPQHDRPTVCVIAQQYSFVTLDSMRFHYHAAVPQWLRCRATNQKVADSIPVGVIGFFIDIKILPIALSPWGSTQPLTAMSTRSVSWG